MTKQLQFISSLVALRMLTPGRALFAIEGIRQVAEPEELAVIDEALQNVVGRARTLLRLIRTWQAEARLRQGSSGRTEVRPTDARVDGIFGSIHGPLERAVRYLADGLLKEAALEVLDGHFPLGLGAVTSLRYEDELAEAQDLLATLHAEAYAELVDALGLRVWRAALEEALPQYDAAIRVASGVSLTYSEVRAARVALHEAVCRLVVVVAGRFDTEQDGPRRARLLAPIEAQDQAVGFLLQRKERVKDVDAVTGVELEDLDDAEPAPPEVAPPGVAEPGV